MVLGHRPIGGFSPPLSDSSFVLGEKPIASPSDSSEFGAVQFIQDIFRQATDPTMVIPMLLASPIYHAGKVGLLRAFTARPAETWLGRSLTLNILPELGGFASETLAFSLSSRALGHYLQGPVAWDPATLINDTAMTGLTLGFLKGTGLAGRKLLQGTLGLNEFQAALWTKADHRALFWGGQVSGYLGLVGSHFFQGRLFPEFHREGGNIWVDALGTHLALGLGAYGGRSLLGSRFVAVEQGLARQAHQLQRENRFYFTPFDVGKKALALGPSWTVPQENFDTGLDYSKGGGPKAPKSHVPKGRQKTPVPSSAESLRDYQKEMLAGLNRDLQKADLPWLGIASPMQTGKSHLIPHIIPMAEKIFGKDTEFVILSSARIITKQIMEDLLGTMGDGEVGRLDGLVKDPKRITVASIYTLYKNAQLKRFAPDGRKRVVIMDEAYFTQAPIVQRILQHFGLAKGIQEGIRTRIVPKANPNARLIGLSGTGDGLGHYHLSGHLNLLDAVEDGWVRNMVGERVFPKIDVEKRQNAYERMIWWKANRENAEYCAKIYREKIQDRFERNLVYVPTIAHGRLLVDQLKTSGEKVHFVHSKMEAEDIEEALAAWEAKGGALVSVRMLSHGFRGKSVGAVFHTYQSTSPELFSQRTGRAWAGEGELYVLEATWDRERFSNLARILGLVEYPRVHLKVGPGLKERILRIKIREDWEKKLNEKIKLGEVHPFFKGIPSLEEWRVQFESILRNSNFSALLKETDLDPRVLSGFALGTLPIRQGDILELSRYLGGEEEVLRLWVGSWERIVEEIRSGERSWKDPNREALENWAKTKMELNLKAKALEEILAPKIRPIPIRIDHERKLRAFSQVISRLKTQGEKVSPQRAADLAHEAYCQGLPEGQWPSQVTFRGMIGGKNKDSAVRKILEEAGVLEPQRHVIVDPERKRWAFAQVITQLKIHGKKVVPQKAADLAHEAYCQGLPEEQWPSQGTFRNITTGKRKDSEIWKMLEEAGVWAPQRIGVDPGRKRWAFSQVIAQLKAQGEKIFPQKAADLAHEVYCQGLPEEQWPSQETFRNITTGKRQDSEIRKMLEEAGVLETQRHVIVDPERKRWAFSQVITRLKIQGEKVSARKSADLAHEVYCQGLPEEQWPSQETFRQMPVGRNKDREVRKMLQKAGVLK